MQDGTGCNTTQKESAASLVFAELERTAERAQKTAAVVAERTSSVVCQEPPQTMSEQAAKQPRIEYPPFFDLIRQKTESINDSLSQIEDTMLRCEL